MLKKTTIKKKYTLIQKKSICVLSTKIFTDELLKWKNEIIKANNLETYLIHQMIMCLQQTL